MVSSLARFSVLIILFSCNWICSAFPKLSTVTKWRRIALDRTTISSTSIFPSFRHLSSSVLLLSANKENEARNITRRATGQYIPVNEFNPQEWYSDASVETASSTESVDMKRLSDDEEDFDVEEAMARLLFDQLYEEEAAAQTLVNPRVQYPTSAAGDDSLTIPIETEKSSVPTVSVQSFIAWDEIQDILQRGIMDEYTLAIILSEVGINVKSYTQSSSNAATDLSAAYQQRMNLTQFIDAITLVNQIAVALETNPPYPQKSKPTEKTLMMPSSPLPLHYDKTSTNVNYDLIDDMYADDEEDDDVYAGMADEDDGYFSDLDVEQEDKYQDYLLSQIKVSEEFGGLSLSPSDADQQHHRSDQKQSDKRKPAPIKQQQQPSKLEKEKANSIDTPTVDIESWLHNPSLDDESPSTTPPVSSVT